LAVAIVLVANFGRNDAPRGTANPPPPLRIGRPDRSPRAGVQDGLRTIVATVRPAVVRISAPELENDPRMRSGAQLLDPFPTGNGWVGSGIIIDPSGLILSCRHATGDAEVVQVTLFRSGPRTFIARRLATDPATGLVLLKLPFGGDLPFATLGDSSHLRTGDLVIALGSPFGLAESVTQGIVSATARKISVEGQFFSGLVQTDAAINQGNCGGPLVDINADVVGVNLAIYSTDSAFSGIGFAIPSDQARAFIARTVRPGG